MSFRPGRNCRNVPECDIKTRAIAHIGQRLKELPASFREPWRELLKSFPAGESKAQSRTETIQGSGESGIQRTQRAGFGAERKILEIAQKAVNLTRNEPAENAVDAFLQLDRQNTYTREQIVKAINQVRSEDGRRAS